MIRNWYNRIPHPAPRTKRERNTNNKTVFSNKIVQAENQEDSPTPNRWPSGYPKQIEHDVE